jgi:soluble cytochrome b562
MFCACFMALIRSLLPVNRVISMKTLSRYSFLPLVFALLLPLRTFAVDEHDSQLHEQMEAINHNFRLVSRQYTDPSQKTSTLEFVAAMQLHAEKARTLTPPKVDKLAGDEQTKYLDAFHKDLDALVKEIGALRLAIVADKLDVAKAEIDKIQQLKGSSHKELGVGGDHGHGGPPPPGAPPGPPPGP